MKKRFDCSVSRSQRSYASAGRSRPAGNSSQFKEHARPRYALAMCAYDVTRTAAVSRVSSLPLSLSSLLSEKDYDGTRKKRREMEESRPGRRARLVLEECLLARWNAN